MLASPANQLTDAETTIAEKQARTASLLTLEFSGTQHEPVLLSPGKWNVGSDASNQIVLNDAAIAARQFLIIVTEHRSVIRDWSTKALWNGNLFDNAVLDDGDTVEVADLRMSFRLAKSQELISQLPYVAEARSHDEAEVASGTDGETARGESLDSVLVTADGMLSFDDGADRLDELISRIESSLVSDSSETVSFDDGVNVLRSAAQNAQSSFEFEASANGTNPVAPQPDEQSLELQAARVDEELRQLEELRAAVQIEREQLLAKRELLVQETRQAESQLAEVRRKFENRSVDEEAAAVDAVGFESAEQSSVDSTMHVENGNEEDVVAAEREKLRHYLEEFESVDDSKCEQLEEVKVAVGAAQAVAEYSVMNALRSRDDAVRQLDELVLAATKGRSVQPAATTNLLFEPVANDRSHESSGGSVSPPSDENELMGRGAEQSAVEVSVEVDDASDLEALDLEVSIEELGALINEVEPEATLANEETNELSSHESGSLTEDSETEDAQELTESALDESTVSYDAETDEASDEFDLSALTAGLDVEAEESGLALAKHGVLPQVQFDDLDSSAPSFGDDSVDDELAAHGIVDLGLSESDEDEESFSLQSSDDYEIDEESSAEHADEAPFADPDFVLEAVEGESLSTNSESNSDDMDSDTEVVGLDPDQLHEERPSWFDSTLMTEGDSVVDEQRDDDPSTTDDGTCSKDDPSTGDLRRRLAEMFDLPALSDRTRTVASDSSVKSSLQQIQAESPAHESAEVDGDITGSSWSAVDGDVDCSESDSGMSVDATTDSVADSDLEFESETLDEFPSTVAVERVQPVEPTSSSFEPAELGEAEDSISAYMERLLARNRQVTGGGSASTETSDKVPPASAGAASKTASESTENGVEEIAVSKDKPETWLEETPRHRQNRDQVRAEVQVLRQIANQSARSAVATASRRDVRKQVMVKTTASILALGSGVAALLLEVSTPFGLVVLGIGLLFSIDLALTIFRNWKQLRALRKAAAALKREARTSDIESTGETA